MSIKSVAATFTQEGCTVYPHAVQYGDHYAFGEQESIDGLYTPLLHDGVMIGSEYHLVELIALADQDAWERYESVEWFAKRGIPDHTPRV